MPNTYIVVSDSIFAGKAARELKEIFPGKVSNVRHFGSYALAFLADIDAAPSDALATFKEHDTVFASRLIPVSAKAYYGNNIEAVITTVSPVVPKGGTFKLEVKKVLSTLTPGAKELEIAIGSRLEAAGARVDLESPGSVVYVILARDTVYVGLLDREDAITLDRFRASNTGVQSKVSRSEFKLEEAIEEFGIDRSKILRCIDVGAAPGGWTDCMARSGAKVLAIDNAALDYVSLSSHGKICVVSQAAPPKWAAGIKAYTPDSLASAVRDNEITHLISNADSADATYISSAGPFDALLVDVNAPPSRSAAIARLFARALRKGAVLVLTIKMVDERVMENIYETKEALSADYSGMRVKKLPHDRHELTLFAVRS